MVWSPNWAGCGAFCLLCGALAGCASPGPPSPPSLNLPEIPAASTLSATRVGSAVIVRWTTPERTTDRLLIKGPVEAEICRDVVNDPTLAARTSAMNPPEASPSAGGKPCAPVVATAVAQSGKAGEATDMLPAQLASGMPRLLAYRVQLKNAAGRTAGPSASIYAAAGDALAPLKDFRAHLSKAGAVLEWTPEAESHGETVELQRTATDPRQQNRKPGSVSEALSGQKEPAEVHLQAGNGAGADPGGTVDRSVEIGHTYRYVASRVRTVSVGGEQLEVRSAPSAAVMVPVADVFPPDAPEGLVAVPGFTGEGPAAHAVIDLSWEPNDEPRVAGYRVYRRAVTEAAAAGPWQRVSGEQPLAEAAYRDTDVSPGQRYAYRVTAIGLNGLESEASHDAEETATAP